MYCEISKWFGSELPAGDGDGSYLRDVSQTSVLLELECTFRLKETHEERVVKGLISCRLPCEFMSNSCLFHV